MITVSKGPKILLLLASVAVAGPVMAQQDQPAGEAMATVYGTPPADLSGLPAGPVVDGIISARSADKMQVTGADGTATVIAISDGTEIKSSGGFLGLNRSKLGANALLNGLPVSVRTVQWNNSLLASRVDLKTNDLKTAKMIRNGTAQGFAEQTAATEALRGRLGDIDKYNIKGTTNVYFDTGKWNLTPQAQDEICAAASQANGIDNALLLVVGYTDTVGSQDYNQVLSERRAGRVVNYLQQACHWKPWRMLTPTGMAEADPAAENSTPQGRAQNRRVSVNILVSKSADGM